MTNASHVRRKLLVDLVDDLGRLAAAHRANGDAVDPTSHERAYQDGAGDALESAARKVKEVLGQDDPDVPDGCTQVIVNLTTNRVGDLYWIADALGLSRTDAVNWALMKGRQHVAGEKRTQEMLAKILGMNLLEVRRVLGWHSPGLGRMELADWQQRSPGHNIGDSTPVTGEGPTGDGDADLQAAARCTTTLADVDEGRRQCRRQAGHAGPHIPGDERIPE